MHRGAFFEIDQAFLFVVIGSGSARRPRMEDHLCGLGRVRGVWPGDRSAITVLRPSSIPRHSILCMSDLCQREDTCSSSRYSQQLLTLWCRLHKSFTLLVMAQQKISWILDAQADPPNPDKIPEADLVGVTVVLLTCSYRSAGQLSLYSTMELWTDSV